MKDKFLRIRYIILLISFFSVIQAFGQPKIGAFYFDGWTQKQWDNYTLLNFQRGAYKDLLVNEFSEREPAYGWVTSTAENIKRQIDDASEAELDFFIFDWYYCQDIGYTDCFMNNALRLFMEAKNRDKLGFCSMITNDSYDIGPSEWGETVTNLLHQFSNSAYYTVEGRPLVMIYQGNKMLNAFKKLKHFDKALEILKKKSIQQGTGDPLIGIMNIKQSRFVQLKNVDFITTYNDPTAAFRVHKGTKEQEFTYKDLQKGELLNWDWFLNFVRRNKFFVPTVTSNWDDRPWKGKDNSGKWNTPLWYHRATQEEFTQSILNAYYFNTELHTNNSHNLIFINAWNEYGEGSYISKMKNGEFMGESIKNAKKEIQ